MITHEQGQELMRLAEAWSNTRSATSYAIASRSVDRSLDPDGRILEMAIDECGKAKNAFRDYLATITPSK